MLRGVLTEIMERTMDARVEAFESSVTMTSKESLPKSVGGVNRSGSRARDGWLLHREWGW